MKLPKQFSQNPKGVKRVRERKKGFFLVVLLFCFRIWVDSFFSGHQNETEIKRMDLLFLPVSFSFTWNFLLDFPTSSSSKCSNMSQGARLCRWLMDGLWGSPGVQSGAPPAPCAHAGVEFLSLFCPFHLWSWSFYPTLYPMCAISQLRRSV